MKTHTIELTERELRIVLAAMEVAKAAGRANAYSSISAFDRLYRRLVEHDQLRASV